MVGLLPPVLLVALLGLTLGAWAIASAGHSARRKRLKELARRWQLHYAPGDPFRLSGKIAGLLPAPASADTRVRDMIYGRSDGCHCQIFTVHYTLGLVGIKRRARQVVGRIESHHQGPSAQTAAPCLVQADPTLRLIEQYEQVHQRLMDRIAQAAEHGRDEPPVPSSPAR